MLLLSNWKTGEAKNFRSSRVLLEAGGLWIQDFHFAGLPRDELKNYVFLLSVHDRNGSMHVMCTFI